MMRIDGRTIKEDETYSGRIVLDLLKTSYDNGYRRGLLDTTQYVVGYNDGLEEGMKELKEFKELMKRLLSD
jgi:hypothetical protein